MKRGKIYRKIATVMTVCAILLSGCSDIEWDLIGEFFMFWAEDNGVIVGEEIQIGALSSAVVKDRINNLTNSKDNTELDGLDVIRDIERSEELSARAIETYDPELMKEALELRPFDWKLHEKDAVLWATAQNSPAAESAILQSDSLLMDSLRMGGDCMSARRAQLEIRLSNTWEAIERAESQPGWEMGDAKSLRDIHKAASQELKDMNQYKETPFCDDF